MVKFGFFPWKEGDAVLEQCEYAALDRACAAELSEPQLGLLVAMTDPSREGAMRSFCRDSDGRDDVEALAHLGLAYLHHAEGGVVTPRASSIAALYRVRKGTWDREAYVAMIASYGVTPDQPPSRLFGPLPARLGMCIKELALLDAYARELARAAGRPKDGGPNDLSA